MTCLRSIIPPSRVCRPRFAPRGSRWGSPRVLGCGTLDFFFLLARFDFRFEVTLTTHSHVNCPSTPSVIPRFETFSPPPRLLKAFCFSVFGWHSLTTSVRPTNIPVPLYDLLVLCPLTLGIGVPPIPSRFFLLGCFTTPPSNNKGFGAVLVSSFEPWHPSPLLWPLGALAQTCTGVSKRHHSQGAGTFFIVPYGNSPRFLQIKATSPPPLFFLIFTPPFAPPFPVFSRPSPLLFFVGY